MLQDSDVESFLNQSCDIGPNRMYCMAIWSNVTSQLSTNTSVPAVEYSVSYIATHKLLK